MNCINEQIEFWFYAMLRNMFWSENTRGNGQKPSQPLITTSTSKVPIKIKRSNLGHKTSASSSTFLDNGQAPVIPATHHTHMTHLRSVIGLHTCIADRDWLMNLAPALMRRVSVSYLYGRSALNVPSPNKYTLFFPGQSESTAGIAQYILRMAQERNVRFVWFDFSP